MKWIIEMIYNTFWMKRIMKTINLKWHWILVFSSFRFSNNFILFFWNFINSQKMKLLSFSLKMNNTNFCYWSKNRQKMIFILNNIKWEFRKRKTKNVIKNTFPPPDFKIWRPWPPEDGKAARLWPPDFMPTKFDQTPNLAKTTPNLFWWLGQIWRFGQKFGDLCQA